MYVSSIILILSPEIVMFSLIILISSLEIILSGYTSACGGKFAYLRISPDPVKAGLTLSVIFISVIHCKLVNQVRSFVYRLKQVYVMSEIDQSGSDCVNWTGLVHYSFE